MARLPRLYGGVGGLELSPMGQMEYYRNWDAENR